MSEPAKRLAVAFGVLGGLSPFLLAPRPLAPRVQCSTCPPPGAPAASGQGSAASAAAVAVDLGGVAVPVELDDIGDDLRDRPAGLLVRRSPTPSTVARAAPGAPRRPSRPPGRPPDAPRRAPPSAPRTRTARMLVTAYCPCRKCCGGFSDARTASGQSIYSHGSAFVAADTRVLPFGTWVSVPGYQGARPVQVLDRGRRIRGRRLDVFFLCHARARRWGARWLDVTVFADGRRQGR